MTFNDFNDWLSYIKGQFHTVIGLLITIGVSFLLVVTPIHAAIREDYNYEIVTFATCYLGVFIFWLYHRYKYPASKKDKTNLIISIYASSREEIKIKNLFLTELERSLNDSELYKVFHVINLKNHFAMKIKNNDDISKLDKRIKGHIYYYGDIQKEFDGAKNKYYLSINGVVKHQPLKDEIRKELSLDFSKLLPKEINFESFYGLKECKATAKTVYLTTKYVAGVASFFSGNPFLAYRLHNGLEEELKKYKEIKSDIGEFTTFDLKYLNKLRKKLPLIISNECMIISSAYYRDGKSYEAKKYIDISLQANPKNYNSLLLKAIFDFTYSGDPASALVTIKKAEENANGSNQWRYSKAFLLFWEGQYEKAWSECQKISKKSFIGEEIILKEVEDFNLNLLSLKKEKPQLYFWLGYLQYKKNYNIPMAFDYFNKFISNATRGHNLLIPKANSYLSEIKNQMEIK